MDMQFGQLAGNVSINAGIYACLAKVNPKDVAKFFKNFRTQPPAQAHHTYRELLVGANLSDHGLQPRYDLEIDGKTPDWSLLDEQEKVIGIVELPTFHQNAQLDREIGETLGRGEIWAGWMPQNTGRLYQKVQQKAERYARLAGSAQVPYVVAVFGEFTASVDLAEVEEVLFSSHGGAFTHFPWLCGLLYFEESSGIYAFKCYANSDARRALPLQTARI